MIPTNLGALLRFAAPQCITGGRAVLGAWALFLAIDNDANRAAILLIMGVITDRLDGLVAKRLHVASEFGYVFDLFADYLYYVAVPTVLAFRMAGSPHGGALVGVFCLPFLFGAIRYARNLIWSRTQSFDRDGFPGLPTLIYAFGVVALVFLRRENAIPASAMPPLLAVALPVFSSLMLAPVRYPKLTLNPVFLLGVTVGLNIMPFLYTEVLAWLTLLFGSMYVVLSPLLFRRKERACPSAQRS